MPRDLWPDHHHPPGSFRKSSGAASTARPSRLSPGEKLRTIVPDAAHSRPRPVRKGGGE